MEERFGPESGMPSLGGQSLPPDATPPDLANLREDDTRVPLRDYEPACLVTPTARFLCRDLWSLGLSRGEVGTARLPTADGFTQVGRGGKIVPAKLGPRELSSVTPGDPSTPSTPSTPVAFGDPNGGNDAGDAGDAEGDGEDEDRFSGVRVGGSAPAWARGRMVKYAVWRSSGLAIACVLAVCALALCVAELAVAVRAEAQTRVAQPPFDGGAMVGSVTGLYSLGPVDSPSVASGGGGGGGVAQTRADSDAYGERLVAAIRAARGGEAFADFPVQCARVYTECSIALVNTTQAVQASNNPLGYACAELFDRDPIGFDPAACGTSVTPKCAYQLSRCGPWLVHARAMRDGAPDLYRAWLREAYVRPGGDLNDTSFSVTDVSAFDEAFFGARGFSYSAYVSGFPDAGLPNPPPNDASFVDAVNGSGVADQVLLTAARKKFYLAVDHLATVNRGGRSGDPLQLRSRTPVSLNAAFRERKRAEMDVWMCAVQLVVAIVAAVPLFVAVTDPDRPRSQLIALAWTLLAIPTTLFYVFPFAYGGRGERGWNAFASDQDGNPYIGDADSAAELFRLSATSAFLQGTVGVDTLFRVGAVLLPVLPAAHAASISVKSLFPESVMAGLFVLMSTLACMVGTTCALVTSIYVLGGTDPLLSGALFVYVIGWLCDAHRVSLGEGRRTVGVQSSGPEAVKTIGGLPGRLLRFLAWIACAVWLGTEGWSEWSDGVSAAGSNDDEGGYSGGRWFSSQLVMGVPGPLVIGRFLSFVSLSYVIACVVSADVLVRGLMAVREGHRENREGTRRMYRQLDTALDAATACEYAMEDARRRIFGQGVTPVVDGPDRIKIDAAAVTAGAHPPSLHGTGDFLSSPPPPGGGGEISTLPLSPALAEKERFATARFEAELRARQLRAEAERAVREDRERREREIAEQEEQERQRALRRKQQQQQQKQQQQHGYSDGQQMQMQHTQGHGHNRDRHNATYAGDEPTQPPPLMGNLPRKTNNNSGGGRKNGAKKQNRRR